MIIPELFCREKTLVLRIASIIETMQRVGETILVLGYCEVNMVILLGKRGMGCLSGSLYTGRSWNSCAFRKLALVPFGIRVEFHGDLFETFADIFFA